MRRIKAIGEVKPVPTAVPAVAPKQELRECVTFRHPGISPEIVTKPMAGIPERSYVIEDNNGEYTCNYVDLNSFGDVTMLANIKMAAGDDKTPSCDCKTFSSANPELFNYHVRSVRYNQIYTLADKYNTMVYHLSSQAKKIVSDNVICSLRNFGVSDELLKRSLEHRRRRFIHDDTLYKLLTAYATNTGENFSAYTGVLVDYASGYLSDVYTETINDVIDLLYSRCMGYIDITTADSLYVAACEDAYEAFFNLGKDIFRICNDMAEESYLVYLSTYPEHKLPDQSKFECFEF